MSANLFNSIQVKKPNRNVFNLSHDVKLSTNMGLLTPFAAMECVPGDKFKIGCDALLRFAPMIAPIMHRVNVFMHWFFVPNRLVWKNWENFITNTKVAGALPEYPYFLVDSGIYNAFPLLDYFGIPNPAGTDDKQEKISALPFACYQKIYEDYYRDQNLIPQNDSSWTLQDGSNQGFVGNVLPMRLRAWEHDYFTSCLPFAQKGDPVSIPIAGFKDVRVIVDQDTFPDPTTWNTVLPAAGQVAVPATQVDPVSGLTSDLWAQTSDLVGQEATINDLRRAFRLQEFLERNARGGTRYIENIYAHFGVKSSDKRLQRPEYITGTKSPVVFSEVLSTSQTDDLPQGNMAGHGASITQGRYGHYFCEEHGWIIGIMSVMPRTAYQNGIHKKFKKFDNLDQYWPEFANIGEQEVKNHEVFAYSLTSDEIFGYVPRYAEYKFENSRVAGAFKTTLNYWHLGRIFAAPPTLSQEFIECSPGDTTRIFAVTDPGDEHLYAHILNDIKAVRSMPKFGTPSF